MNTRTIELPDGWTEELRTDDESSQTFIVLFDHQMRFRAQFAATDDPVVRSDRAWALWVEDERQRMAAAFYREMEDLKRAWIQDGYDKTQRFHQVIADMEARARLAMALNKDKAGRA